MRVIESSTGSNARHYVFYFVKCASLGLLIGQMRVIITSGWSNASDSIVKCVPLGLLLGHMRVISSSTGSNALSCVLLVQIRVIMCSAGSNVRH